MRIHRLQIQAFGPFANRQDIDFDELSASGLFLLNGETGSGKTSILDAICYALYGSLPGAREGVTRLRSDHAAPGTVPEVVCEFSTGNRRFEVTRSPAWERPVKRGTGTTRAQAQSRLREYVDGTWREKSTRNDEVSTEVRAVVGLDKNQFATVAMLPQGEFAAFLRAKDTDRETLLKKLFDTSTYGSVERLLGDLLASARSAAEGAERRIDGARRQLHDDAVASLRLAGRPDPDLPVESTTILLDARIAASDARLGAARARSAATRAEQESLERRLDDHRQLATLAERRARHERSAADVQHAEGKLALHVRAAAVQPFRVGLGAARTEDTQAQVGVADAREKVADDDVASAYAGEHAATGASAHADAEADAGTEAGTDADAGAEAERVARARAAAGDEAAIVDASLPAEAELDALERRLAADRKSFTRATAELEKANSEREQGTARLPQLQAAVETSAKEAGTRDARTAELEAARQRVDAVRRVQEHAVVLAASEERWVQAQAKHVRRQAEALRISRLRLEQAAAALAQGLQDGRDCPVCGGTEHPRPAALPDGELVQDAVEDEARAAAEASGKAELQAREMRDAARQEAARLTALAGTADRAEAQAAADQAETALRVATEATERHRAALAAQAAAVEACERAAVRVGDAQQSLAGLQARIEELAENAKQQALRVEALRDGYPSLAARLKRIRQAQSLLVALERALDRADRSALTVDAAEIAWKDALGEQDFDTDEHQQDALLAPESEAGLHRLVREHHAEGVRVQALATQESVARAARELREGVPVPDEEDLAAATHAVGEAETARDEALKERAVLDAFGRRLTTAGRELSGLLRAQGPVVERFQTVRAMAELARGGGENLLRMTLSTYVLAARFEAVADAATERLAVMSSGRYAMVHDDGRRGNNKSGLGLQVIDAWTGQQRETSTLSGGESFMASLALALGLADVVQQESGGMDMETLFVDEGFGSLDEAALELVMDALDGLRRGGRVVGLVSHVPEMKQRIPAQLRIRKSRTGSETEVVLGETAGRELAAAR